MSAATSPSPPKRRKRLFRILWALLALVVGVGLFWTWSYYSALAERDALIAEVRARGEPVWWDEVAEKALAEQPDDSGAELFLKAIWELGDDFNRSKPGLPNAKLDLDLWNQYPEPTILPEVEAALKLAAPAFDLAKQAVKRRPGLLTRSLRTDDPTRILLPHIQDSRALTRMLRWEAYDALARNDPRRAFKAIILSLSCSEQLAAEPSIISQFVRFASKVAACNHLEMCLAYAAPTKEDFCEIDGLLSLQDDGFGIQFSLIAERAMDLTVFEDRRSLREYSIALSRIRSSRADHWQWLHEKWLGFLSSSAGLPATIRTEAELIRLVDELMPHIDRPNVDLSIFDEIFQRFVNRSPIHRLIENSDNLAIGFLRSFPRSIIIQHRRLIFARLALRLRRYHDQHGKFPDRLDELCDETMPKIRIDWFQNQPITYKPSATGFRLETPESILKPEERSVLEKTPILSDYGLELKLKKLPSRDSKR